MSSTAELLRWWLWLLLSLSWLILDVAKDGHVEEYLPIALIQLVRAQHHIHTATHTRTTRHQYSAPCRCRC